MGWRVKPGMADVIAQGEHQRFSSLADHGGLKRIGSELSNEMRKRGFEQRSPWSVLRNNVLVYLRHDRADDVFGGLVRIADARKHLQVAYNQSLLNVVGHFAIFQILIRPDVDGPNFVRLWADVPTAQHRHQRQQSLTNVDSVYARVSQTCEYVAGKLCHQDGLATARRCDNLN